jgi:hypothetical protein
MERQISDRTWGVLLAAAAALTALASIALAWPGTLTIDTDLQLHQAIVGEITDWHPPITVWLWMLIGRTPGAMLMLQVLLHWLGIWAFAERLRRERRLQWAWLMLLVGLTPLAIKYTAVLQKDTLLTSFFVAAFGLTALLDRQWLSLALGTVGSLCRWNGIFALPPLLLSRVGRITPLKMLIACVTMALLLVPVVDVVNHRLLQAQRTGVERSLQLFDLAGIAYVLSDQSILPAEGRKAAPCYTPLFWDKLIDKECGYSRDQLPPSLTSRWLLAIAHHPLAYAAHRIAHFNRTTFFVVPSMQQCVDAPALHACDFSVRGKIVDLVTKNAFLWPVTWLVIGAILLFSNLLPLSRALVQSGMLYGLAYLLVGVASDFRYFYWTELAIQIAIVMQIARTGTLPRWKPIAWAVGLVLLIGYTARFVLS